MSIQSGDPPIPEADAARDRRDWAEAARLYAAVVALRPEDAGMWVQLGHARREGGDPIGAADAYGRALALDRWNGETHYYLGHAFRLAGEPDRAVAAFAQAARLRPGDPEPARALIAMGARDALPEAAAARLRDPGPPAAAIAHALATLRDWQATAGYARADWDRFRRDIPLRPPPGPLPSGEGVLVRIDAVGASPAALHATLRSLDDQSVRGWTAEVAADPDLAAHPVASLAGGQVTFSPPFQGRGWGWVRASARLEDSSEVRATATEGASSPSHRHPTPDHHRVNSAPRCSGQAGGLTDPDDPEREGQTATTLHLAAGTLLHPEALAWLLHALDRTGAAVAVTDQDEATPHPLLGHLHHSPRLSGVPDQPHALTATRATGNDRTAHIPRVLATILDPSSPARGRWPAERGTEGEDRLTPQGFRPLRPAAPATSPLRGRMDDIAVVIPSRTPALLAQALASLHARAARPDRLRPIVVATGSPFDPLPGTTHLPMPGPFNWSRANRIGAAATDASLLLFLNDDVELLSPGWDEALAAALSDPATGAVGARLLYPDLTVQHGGILFGTGNGRPVHEGRGAPFDDPGPDARFVTRRRVAAVTGAFLATTRDWLAQTGGFDEALAVAYNDLDYCLRVREAGGTILYEPAIEAIHHEGATRGRDPAPDQIAWDDAEWHHLLRRWGAALGHDPSLSPYWTRHVRPFETLREPSMHEILDWIDRTGSGRAWVPVPSES